MLAVTDEFGALAARASMRRLAESTARFRGADGLPEEKPLYRKFWTTAEDRKLADLVQDKPNVRWAMVAGEFENRSAKQCRERWHNCVSPEINKSDWQSHEDQLIFTCYVKYGKKWSKMSKMLKGRPDSAVKNRFITLCKRAHFRKRLQNAERAGEQPPSPPATEHGERCKPMRESDVAQECGLIIDEINAHETGQDSANFLLEEFEKQLDSEHRLPTSLLDDMLHREGRKRLNFEANPALMFTESGPAEAARSAAQPAECWAPAPPSALRVHVKRAIPEVPTHKKMCVSLDSVFQKRRCSVFALVNSALANASADHAVFVRPSVVTADLDLC